MRERGEALQEKLKAKLEEMQIVKTNNESLKTKFMVVREENLKLIDEEFDQLIQRLNDRRQIFKANYQKICTEELEIIEKDLSKQLKIVKIMENSAEQLKKLIESLSITIHNSD